MRTSAPISASGRIGEVEQPAERLVDEQHPAVFGLDDHAVAHVGDEAVQQQQMGGVASPVERLFSLATSREVVRGAALFGDVDARSDIAVELAGRAAATGMAGRVYHAVHAIGAPAPVRRLERHSGGDGLGKRRQDRRRDRQDAGRRPSPSPSSCSRVRPLKSSQRSFDVDALAVGARHPHHDGCVLQKGRKAVEKGGAIRRGR